MLGFGHVRAKAVAFDIIGTLFPLEPMRPALTRLGLPPACLEGWFAAGLRDAFALAATGAFRPLTAVLAGALDEVLAEQSVTAPEAAKAVLIRKLQQLDARSGAAEALQLLAGAGLPAIALSNGSRQSTELLLQAAGLRPLFTAVLSVEDVQQFKPRREVYLHAAETAGIAPADLALVAAHPWDIHGAKAAGLVGAYLSAERPFPSSLHQPDLQAATLPDLVGSIAKD